MYHVHFCCILLWDLHRVESPWFGWGVIMNWIVERPATCKPYPEEFEPCEHVEGDTAVAYMNVTEMDSCGIVSVSILCQECHQAMKAEAAAELVTCHDCGRDVAQGYTIAWKWYDFHAPQGDEPIVVCSECQTAEKHKNRVRDDRQAREAEEDMDMMDPYDDELDDDGDLSRCDDDDSVISDTEHDRSMEEAGRPLCTACLTTHLEHEE